MAYLIGNGGAGPNEGPIANGSDDLLTKLRDFLITQSWTVEKEETTGSGDSELRFIYFKGPDIVISGQTVNAYVNIRRHQNSIADRYNWEIRGAINFNTSQDFDNQPTVSPVQIASGNRNAPNILLEGPAGSPNINYWFVANNRRFIVIAAVQTVYTSLYAGFLLPYFTPSEYRYPLYIGGTAGRDTYRFSQSQFVVGSFFDPPLQAAYLLDPANVWNAVQNYTNSSGNRTSTGNTNVWPYREKGSNFTNNIDTTSYTLLPTVVYSYNSGGNVFGELEGVYDVTGFGLSSTDIITISSVDYLVTQVADRTTIRDFGAIRLQ